MRRFVGGLGYSYTPAEPEPPPEDYTITWVWIGNISTSGATLKARSADAASITLRYSTDPGLAGFSTVAGVEGADEVWKFDIGSLSAGTLYYYGFAGSAVTGSFRTFPSGQASFTIAAASCSSNANNLTFTKIAALDPAVFIHLGDRHYGNISSNNVPAFRTAYANQMAGASQNAMHRTIPVAYVWDDHDFGANNSNGTSASRPAAQQVYREHVPHWELPADTRPGGDGEIYQTFVIGRVRFVLLDCRSERTPNSATDDASKTMLGADQKAWLKDILASATEPVIVITAVTTWVKNATHSDCWRSFRTEQAELMAHMGDNAVTGKTWLIGGDTHRLSSDDGTNTQFDPDDLASLGPPYSGFAPLSQSSTSDGGTYSDGTFVVSGRQYGTMHFLDEGSTITVTAKGWSVATPDVQVFSRSKVFAA